jgi:DNA-binding transcriptional ArsR family regulator
VDDLRWIALDERLRAVEARLGIGPDADGESTVTEPDPDTFWVLTGLRARLAGVEGGGITYAGAVETPGGSAEWQYGLATETLLELDEGTIEAAAARLAALGHPVRLRLLSAVLHGQTSPAVLADLEGMGTTGQVYHHVRALTAAGWLRSAGRSRVEIPSERIVPLLVALTTAI